MTLPTSLGAVTAVHIDAVSQRARTRGAPVGTIGLGTIGRSAGTGTGSGYGTGSMSRPSNARVLRQTVAALGTSLPVEVVSAVEGASDAILACVRTRIGALRFPQPETDEPMRVTLTLSA